MKTDIHPEYRAVVFRDLSSGDTFLTRSTVTSDKTIELDGVTYPVIDVEISSSSHPFYTGKQRIMDSAGRIEKFNSNWQKNYKNAMRSHRGMSKIMSLIGRGIAVQTVKIAKGI